MSTSYPSPRPLRDAGIRPLRNLLEEMGPLIRGIEPSAVSGLDPGFPRLPDADAGMGAMALGPFPEEVKAVSRLREGCYRVRFTPDARRGNLVAWPALEGTFRLETLSPMHWVASADLYRADAWIRGTPEAVDSDRGVGSGGAVREIPSFARDRYHAYLRVLRLRVAQGNGAGGVSGRGLVIDAEVTRLRFLDAGLWDAPEQVQMVFRSARTPSDEPDGNAAGAAFEVRLEGGTVLGEWVMDWVSPFFREAVVEIDTEAGLPAPEDDGAGETWASVFARTGWRVRSELGALERRAPPGGRWTLRDVHEAMVASRSGADLDGEWRYHVSVVRELADLADVLGLAFDHDGSDLNDVPREGVVVHGGVRLSQHPSLGRYAGRMQAECPELSFKVAVHEVGHAMGLHHNHVGHGVMEQVGRLVPRGVGGQLTRESLRPEFAPDDVVRLRHLPDVHVRPGGTPWETAGAVEDHAHAGRPRRTGDARPWATGLRDRSEVAGPLVLSITRLRAELPVGAPLRVDFTMHHSGSRPVDVPAHLGLSTPYVSGWVVGPDGAENEFRSLFKPLLMTAPVRLEPGGHRDGSLTLLRGRRGALLSRPGWHTLWLEVSWTDGDERRCARARARFEVVPPSAAVEERLSRRLRATPETLGYLVFGGGPAYRAGERLVKETLSSPVYGPHFAYVHARAVGARAESGDEERRLVANLLAPEAHRTVLNLRELEKVAALQCWALQFPPPETRSPNS